MADNFEALHGEILDELVAFTGENRAAVRVKMEKSIYRTARLFEERPDTPERFYEETDAYIYELASYEKDSWRANLAGMLGRAMGGATSSNTAAASAPSPSCWWRRGSVSPPATSAG